MAYASTFIHTSNCSCHACLSFHPYWFIHPTNLSKNLRLVAWHASFIIPTILGGKTYPLFLSLSLSRVLGHALGSDPGVAVGVAGDVALGGHLHPVDLMHVSLSEDIALFWISFCCPFAFPFLSIIGGAWHATIFRGHVFVAHATMPAS